MRRGRLGGRCARAALAALGASLGIVAWGADPARVARAEPGAPDRFDTVVIDAGHGGSDEGARGPNGTLEKDVALDVSRALTERLKRHGLRVVMTRDSDVRVPLEQRTALANDARGDLFVSIHANAAPDPAIHGSETFFLALDASDASAAGVAARENQSFDGEEGAPVAALDDPFVALLGDLISSEHLEESSLFARSVQRELASVPVKSRGVKQAMFVVLTGVQMPAALVEIGFITHVRDERVISATAGREQIVAALEKAVLAFGRRYDARRGVGAAAPGE